MTSPDLRRPDRRTRVDSSASAPADAVPMPHVRGLPRWHHAGALIVFVVLALASSYPLPFHLGTHIPGDASGDAATFVWNGWWMRTALESP